MSTPTIKELGNLSADELVPQLHVHVKKAWMPDRGKSGNRSWKRQSAMVQDTTGEIRATFWNFERDLRDLEGNDIVIKSGDERGITTIDYENKKTHVVERQISIEKEATIDEIVGEPSQPAKGNGLPKGAALPSECQGTRVKVYENESVKRESIERQQALEQAVKLAPEKATADEVILVAEKFYTFLSSRIIPAILVPEAPDPVEAPAVTDGDQVL